MATFSTRDGKLQYQLTHNDSVLLAPGRLGFTEETLGEITQDIAELENEFTDKRETYSLPWGEVKNIDEAYQGMTLQLRHTPTGLRLALEARMFDEGLGRDGWGGSYYRLRFEHLQSSGAQAYRLLYEYGDVRSVDFLLAEIERRRAGTSRPGTVSAATLYYSLKNQPYVARVGPKQYAVKG